MAVSISYAITVCKELKEIERLIDFLHPLVKEEDEIIVLFDEKSGTSEVKDLLSNYEKAGLIELYSEKFNNHFADWKNLLTEYCTKEYIFQIDADELPSENLVANLGTVLETNPTIEVFLVPRVNTVEGITDEHIYKWRWRLDNKGRINWPDMQWRVYKNDEKIKWVNKVHENLKGFKTFTALPMEEEWALYHPKTIERQEKQNAYYDTL